MYMYACTNVYVHNCTWSTKTLLDFRCCGYEVLYIYVYTRRFVYTSTKIPFHRIGGVVSHTCAHTYIYAHTYIHTCTCNPWCVWVLYLVLMYICAFTYWYLIKRGWGYHVHLYIYMYIYVYIYVYIYACSYIHTIHTCIRRP